MVKELRELFASTWNIKEEEIDFDKAIKELELALETITIQSFRRPDAKSFFEKYPGYYTPDLI